MQSFAERWHEIAPAHGVETISLDAYGPDVVERVRECDGFMWRLAFEPPDTTAARRILWSIEQGLQLPVFPAFKSIWFFEDKIAQAYLLEALGFPHPRTSVFWREEDALGAIENMSFPVVAKLSAGVRSNSVVAIGSAAEATALVRKMFGIGASDLLPGRRWTKALLGRRAPAAGALVRGTMPHLEKGYVLFQEFVHGNDFDTKLILIGNRVLGIRRDNRPGDFRASGGGRINWDPQNIDARSVAMCFQVADALGADTLAFDFLMRDGEPVISEMSFSAALNAFAKCPGHWRRSGGQIEWVERPVNPADAIFEDFLHRVRNRDISQRPKPTSID
jgi:glutathione synthase/RimK-type ligase-like ATP-grasp enzyme